MLTRPVLVFRPNANGKTVRDPRGRVPAVIRAPRGRRGGFHAAPYARSRARVCGVFTRARIHALASARASADAARVMRSLAHLSARVLVLTGAFALACAASCRAPAMKEPNVVPAPPKVGDEIVVCGQRFHTGAPVVLWTQTPGYDSYQLIAEKPTTEGAEPEFKLAYQPGRQRTVGEGMVEMLVAPHSTDLASLQKVVDQFVLHYDVCGVSRTCHKVLRERGLSVHFMLDVDGTIYQTMDLADTAWHATKSNPRSVGIEIANMGAYANAQAKPLTEWYARDVTGTYLALPERLKGGGVRVTDTILRPARTDPVRGEIHGTSYVQYDYTPEQYDSLAKLTAALCRALPRIRPDAPRGKDGAVLSTVLTDAEWTKFGGVLGHYHVQRNKQDPGPAFDWEKFLGAVRGELAAP